MLIIKVPFQEKDSGVSTQASVPATGTAQSEAIQKAATKKNASPPSKRGKVPILNEEKVDNTLVNSPRESPKRTLAPAQTLALVPTNISSEEK